MEWSSSNLHDEFTRYCFDDAAAGGRVQNAPRERSANRSACAKRRVALAARLYRVAVEYRTTAIRSRVCVFMNDLELKKTNIKIRAVSRPRYTDERGAKRAGVFSLSRARAHPVLKTRARSLCVRCLIRGKLRAFLTN